MRGRHLFLQWSLFVCMLAIGLVILARLGWSGYVLQGDSTHVTLVTFGVFVLTTVWCGRLAWRASSGENPELIRHDLETSWFASSVCVTLGLLGTVIGYLILAQAAGGGEEAADQLVRQIRLGMSTVLVNTVVGGACGLFIEIQSHFLGRALKPAAKPPIDVRHSRVP